MKERGYVIAVLGAGGEIGRELQVALRERAFPVGECRLFECGEGVAEIGDEVQEPLLGTDQIDVRGADLVFMCGTGAVAVEWAPQALEARAVVIDLTQSFADKADVPVVVPEINPGVLDAVAGGGIVANPVPGATALSVVLNPLEQLAQLKRVVVACYEPVSQAGRDGIEELARQTRDLLGGRAVENAVFPHRIAFNLIPQVGPFVVTGSTRGEWQIESQTRRVLDLPDLPITATAVLVPTFFGQGYAVNVETQQPIDAEAARRILREAPGILVLDDVGRSSYPTLVDALGAEATYVGRIRDDPTVPYGVSLWAAIDGLRKGAAVNAVQIAERIIQVARQSTADGR